MAKSARQAASAMNPLPDQTHRQSPESHQEELPDVDALAAAKRKAGQLAGDLRKDYPILKPYLVLTMKGAYVEADSSVSTMLEKAPGLFDDNAFKTAALAHLQKEPPLELQEKGNEKKLERWKDTADRKFREIALGLRLLPDALFEIRFGHLDYGEIQRMQKDERVDAVRTPQTSASIRIVIGSVVDFVPGDVAPKSVDQSGKERGSMLSHGQRGRFLQNEPGE